MENKKSLKPNIKAGKSRLYIAKVSRAADELYWSELEKPENERDESLMEECLGVITEAERILSADKSERKGNARIFARIASVACAFLIALVVATGICYAYGINLWNIIIKSGENTISVGGEGNSESEYCYRYVDTNGFINFDSTEAACEYLMQNPRLLCLTERGYDEYNVQGMGNSTSTTIDVEYRCYDEAGFKYVFYNVSSYPDGNTAFERVMQSDDGEYDEVSIGGVVYYFAEKSGEIVVFGSEGGYFYQINSNVPIDELKDMIVEMKTYKS